VKHFSGMFHTSSRSRTPQPKAMLLIGVRLPDASCRVIERQHSWWTGCDMYLRVHLWIWLKWAQKRLKCFCHQTVLAYQNQLPWLQPWLMIASCHYS